MLPSTSSYSDRPRAPDTGLSGTEARRYSIFENAPRDDLLGDPRGCGFSARQPDFLAPFFTRTKRFLVSYCFLSRYPRNNNPVC